MKTQQKPNPQPHEPPQSLMSRKHVASKLGVSCMTVKHYQNRGLLKPIYLSSRAVRYRAENVENLILEATV